MLPLRLNPHSETTARSSFDTPTPPIARVMVEAVHDADAKRYGQSIANALHSSIGAYY